MAILNGYEGPACVEVESEGVHWKGYILLASIPANIEFFNLAGSNSNVLYEGPVLIKGQYMFAVGEATVTHVELGQENITVDFEGTRSLHLGKTLPGRPADFLD